MWHVDLRISIPPSKIILHRYLHPFSQLGTWWSLDDESHYNKIQFTHFSATPITSAVPANWRKLTIHIRCSEPWLCTFSREICWRRGPQFCYSERSSKGFDNDSDRSKYLPSYSRVPLLHKTPLPNICLLSYVTQCAHIVIPSMVRFSGYCTMCRKHSRGLTMPQSIF